MLLATHELLSMPVMSLQTGAEIGSTDRTVIDPSSFQILAYELSGQKLDTHPAFLRVEDIRELSDFGFIVDSSDEILTLDDIVTAKEIYKKPFRIEGMKVVDDTGTKLGKVEQSIMDTDTFRVEQLQIRQSFFKSLADTNLIIHRNQIIDVQEDKIIVRSPTVSADSPDKPRRQPLVNPFRSATPPQPESAKATRQ